MSDFHQQLAARVEERFEGLIGGCTVAVNELTVEVPQANLLSVCRALRDEEAFAFEQLMDLCGVDYSTYGKGDVEEREFHLASPAERAAETAPRGGRPRFAAVYHLLSIARNQRIRLRCYATEGDIPTIPSVIEVWNSANWYEREAFDLYGIVFEGHPDLRRILTDYGFIGHPFRKDFPLTGNVEMRYDPDKERVVYEPVSIEPRELVPHVIRRDHRYDRNSETGGGN